MNSNQFITDVAVVSSKDKCPPGYTILSSTTSGSDADLYEGSFLKAGARYLCFAKMPASTTVVTDLNIVKEKDSIPAGFTAVKCCKNDAGEKSLRKHVLCVRTENVQKAQSGVVNILAMHQSKGERAPGNCYTISTDVNGINICYQIMPCSYIRQPPYGHHASMAYRPPMVQPSYPGQTPYPGGGPGAQPMPVPVSLQGTAPPTHNQVPSPGSKQASAIQGVLFQVNPKFERLWEKPNVSEEIASKRSISDIEKKYVYNFETERHILST